MAAPTSAARVASAAEDLQAQSRSFFEPQLVAIGLGKEQIERQALAELEESLERINDCIKHPESFGTLKVKMGGTGVLIISTEAQFEVGILPILLERKRSILDRITSLKGDEKIESLKDIIRESTDKNVQVEIDKQINELQLEIRRWQEKTREAEQAQMTAQFEQQSKLAQISADMFERRSKVWLSFLQRESVATIVGGLLLIVMTISIVVANFVGIATSELLSNAFLVILGYFFGQAVGRASVKD